jgi:ferritin-like metal-binding protein YciE
MDKLKNLEELFHHELKDLYSAESQIIDALPKMAENANDSQLKNSFQMHLEQTRQQKERLNEIGSILGIELDGHKCDAMAGIVKEGQGLMHEKANPATKDAGLIAAAQKIEHYEIASYGTARYYAMMLGNQKVASMLEQTLNEEKATDQKLNALAENKINIESQREGSSNTSM